LGSKPLTQADSSAPAARGTQKKISTIEEDG
jgi:hypothetical protein